MSNEKEIIKKIADLAELEGLIPYGEINQKAINAMEEYASQYKTRIEELEREKEYYKLNFEEFQRRVDQLQSKPSDSDAVEFAEWMSLKINKKEMNYWDGNNKKPWTVWLNNPHGINCDHKELYQLFLKSKQNESK